MQPKLRNLLLAVLLVISLSFAEDSGSPDFDSTKESKFLVSFMANPVDGACGDSVTSSVDSFARVAESYWVGLEAGEEVEKICNNMCAHVWRKDESESVEIPIKDSCARCSADQLQVSQPAFESMEPLGIKKSTKIKWKIATCGSDQEATPSQSTDHDDDEESPEEDALLKPVAGPPNFDRLKKALYETPEKPEGSEPTAKKKKQRSKPMQLLVASPVDDADSDDDQAETEEAPAFRHLAYDDKGKKGGSLPKSKIPVLKKDPAKPADGTPDKKPAVPNKVTALKDKAEQKKDAAVPDKNKKDDKAKKDAVAPQSQQPGGQKPPAADGKAKPAAGGLLDKAKDAAAKKKDGSPDGGEDKDTGGGPPAGGDGKKDAGGPGDGKDKPAGGDTKDPNLAAQQQQPPKPKEGQNAKPAEKPKQAKDNMSPVESPDQRTKKQKRAEAKAAKNKHGKHHHHKKHKPPNERIRIAQMAQNAADSANQAAQASATAAKELVKATAAAKSITEMAAKTGAAQKEQAGQAAKAPKEGEAKPKAGEEKPNAKGGPNGNDGDGNDDDDKFAYTFNPEDEDDPKKKSPKRLPLVRFAFLNKFLPGGDGFYGIPITIEKFHESPVKTSTPSFCGPVITGSNKQAYVALSAEFFTNNNKGRAMEGEMCKAVCMKMTNGLKDKVVYANVVDRCRPVKQDCDVDEIQYSKKLLDTIETKLDDGDASTKTQIKDIRFEFAKCPKDVMQDWKAPAKN